MATAESSLQLADMKQEYKPISITGEMDTVNGVPPVQAGSFADDANKENVGGSAEGIANSMKDEVHNENNDEDDTPAIDININNVVCCFNLRCHINLQRVAMEGSNVEYRRQHGVGIFTV